MALDELWHALLAERLEVCASLTYAVKKHHQRALLAGIQRGLVQEVRQPDFDPDLFLEKPLGEGQRFSRSAFRR